MELTQRSCAVVCAALFIFVPIRAAWSQGQPESAPASPAASPASPHSPRAGDDDQPGTPPGEPAVGDRDDVRGGDEPATHQTPGELSMDELAEIEAALEKDAADLAESRPHDEGPRGVAAALQSMNPDISLILDLALAYFSDGDHLQSGAHDPQQTGFNLQQVEMFLGKAVDPYFRVDATLVFSEYGVEVEEAYATTLALPWNLQARAGQFLTRVGRINSTHPHSWDFVDQPFAIGRIFGAEGNRGAGTELSYLTPLPWYVEVVASATNAGGEATARSFFGPQPLPVESPLDVQWSLMIKQFFELGDDLSLLVGLSAANGPNSTGHDNRSDVYATDLYLRYRPIGDASDTLVTLQTEWFYRRRQIARDLLADVSGYAQVLWHLATRWDAAARYEYGSPARNLAGAVGADYLDPGWIDHRHRVSANLTMWPTEFSRLRVQGSVDAPTWRPDPVYALFFAMEFSIGAHGAHSF
jgi:hypothetical protein